MRRAPQIAGYFYQAVRVGAVIRTHNEQQISFFSNMFNRNLAVFSGVADILSVRATNIGELLLEGSNRVFGFVEAQSRLGDIGHTVRIGHHQGLNFLRVADHLGHERGLTQGPDDLIMVTVADQDDGIAFLGVLNSLHVDLGDQGTGGIHYAEVAFLAGLPYFGRDTMGAVDDALSIRDFFHAIHENSPFAL